MRILSGMRPSGRLHLGNYWGALKNWVALQNEGNSCYYMVADWHALTTEYDKTDSMSANIKEMLIDWISAGLDPQKSVLFRQSDVTEHAELTLMLSMITPLGWLERCPTYKEQLRELSGREIQTHGFLGYPVLQAADILLYEATHVPVGEDQLPHLELTREIARRFNHLYGKTLVEPQSKLSSAPRLPGIDGINRKMSKTYGNAIELADTPKVIAQKVNQMFTDPQKIRASDPGHPEGCVVCTFHRVYNPDWEKEEELCRLGKVGCVPRKKKLAQLLSESLEPIQKKRQELEGKDQFLNDILAEGAKKARVVAGETLKKARKAMRINA